jgi:uncharacterized glyoxalase superfamily protein PhnB
MLPRRRLAGGRRAELDRLYESLKENGQVLMALSDYGLSTKFGWVNDRASVSAGS